MFSTISVRELIKELRQMAKTVKIYPDCNTPSLGTVKSLHLQPAVFGLLQGVGILLLWTMVTLAVVPCYWFGNWVQNDLQAKLWSYFSIDGVNMYGFLLPLVIPRKLCYSNSICKVLNMS